MSEAASQRRMFEHVTGFVAILSGPDHIYEYANQAYIQVAGNRDFVGKTVRQAFPDLEGTGLFEALDTVFSTGQRYVANDVPFTLQRTPDASADNLIVSFTCQPMFDDAGRVTGIFVQGQDVSQAHQATAELAESEERFRTLADNMSQLAWTADPTGFIYWYNSRWFDYTGRTLADMEGWGWRSVHHPDHVERVVERIQHSWDTGEVWEDTFPLRSKDGEYRWFLSRALPIRDAEGNIRRWLGTNTDITAELQAKQALRELNEQLEERVASRTAELEKSQNALRQSQKMEAVGQLTGGLAHDFNNLLTGISGSLDMLKTRLAQGRTADVEKYLTVAQGAASRAAALTHRLLAFSRQQTLDPRPTHLNQLVTGMDELIRRSIGPGVTMEVIGAAGLWLTLVDPPQLENALLNLCINARDAMPGGGRLTIETANKWLDARAADERDLTPGQYVSLCVTDTGEGMSPETVKRIFDPFFTTKPLGSGTGLGLSMIYGFTKQSGGQVRVYSELGVGTTMCIYLPRYRGEVREDVPTTAPRSAKAGHGEVVLVVDDEPSVRVLVADVLADLGYTALEAADAAAGLVLLRAQDVRIDLLITDVGLPGGMNGRQLADTSKLFRPDLKVLFITGYAENAVIGNGHLDASMQILTKPFAMDTLASRIKDMLAR